MHYELLSLLQNILDLSLDAARYQGAEHEKKLQQAEQANYAKTQLLITVSHELRTPIAGILGMIRVLNKISMPVQAKEYIYDIKIAAEHVLSLVNDLLDISKIESGKMELAYVPFNLKQLIEETVAMLSYPARQKKLKLFHCFSEDVPTYIVSDERAIKQIVINLVSNAIKFTEQGHVSLKIGMSEQVTGHPQLKISVEDTGIGIPVDKLESIFEQFSHADKIYSRQQGGTGLGLALCRSYLELMGGVIAAHSEVGVGSTFYCIIPFAMPIETKRKEPANISLQIAETLQDYVIDTDSSESKSTKKVKALLVEDNLVVQKAHVMLLQDLGCAVEVLDRGELALARVQQGEHYDIIFMDLGLPDCKGTQIAEKIRQWELQNKL